MVPGGITYIIYFVAVSAVVVSLYATVDMRRSGVWGGTRYRCAAVHEDANWLGCGGLRSAHCREMWGRGCRGADSGSDYQENTSVRRGRAFHDAGLNACCLIIIGESFDKHPLGGATPPSYEPSYDG